MVPARCRAKFARSWADLGANTLNIHPLYCSMHTVDNTLCTGIVGIALPTLQSALHSTQSFIQRWELLYRGNSTATELKMTRPWQSTDAVSCGLAPVMTFHGCSDYVWRNLNNLNASLHSAAAESRCLLSLLWLRSWGSQSRNGLYEQNRWYWTLLSFPGYDIAIFRVWA